MTKEPKALPTYPQKVVLTPQEESSSDNTSNEPTSVVPKVLIPTKYKTFVRVLVDMDCLEHDLLKPVNEGALLALKAGDVIEVSSREEVDHWIGKRGNDVVRFNLDERVAPVLNGRVHALWDRHCDPTEELNFDEGDTIQLLYKESNWWYWCEGNGRVGLVPFNYVESIPPNGYVDNLNPASFVSKGLATLTEWSNNTRETLKVRAVWDWEGEEVRDLTLKEDDVVEVITRFHKDWWFGRVNDRIGIFPSCYVTEEIDKLIGPKRPVQRPPWYPYYVIALYSTTPGDNSYELKLDAGHLIMVEYICSDRWWKGRTREGKTGWFPDNYVRPVLDRRQPFMPGSGRGQ